MLTIEKSFKTRFGKSPKYQVKAPGRINVIGEHTDYNGGFVLPAAVNKYMEFASAKNASKSFRIYAVDLDEYIEFSSESLSTQKESWANYMIGILLELQKLNMICSGMDIVFGSNIPMGGGMSSSAALEMGFLQTLNQAFELGLEGMQMVDISHRSNHLFLGIKGGIMDQMSILFSKRNHCLMIDCATRVYQNIPMKLSGFSFVVFNTMVQHDHQSSGYNEVVKTCNEIKQALQKNHSNLKHISESSDSDLVSVKTSLSKKHWMKLKYVQEENKRVVDLVSSAKDHDYISMGQLIYASHDGLQYEYQVSCKELDFVVELARKSPHILGARMMGGGFGGCVLLLVDNEHMKTVMNTITEQYQSGFGLSGSFLEIETVDGLLV